MNIDIDTQEAPPALIIQNDKQLCDVVYALASKQLIINSAEAEMQAKVEAAKKAFADATEPITSEIKALFAAVEAYAETNKDRLFPVKKGKRVKTFPVLAHKLQYRSSDQVEAPANAAHVVENLIAFFERQLEDIQSPDDEIKTRQLLESLYFLIRQPEPELNKDAVKTLNHADAINLLQAHGIRIKTLETFKLAFTFSPEQEAA